MTQDQKPAEEAEKEPIKVAFSLPQIVGGALAAATAATIGSQLGVAGTIVGAAVASIVGGVAGTLYSAGLDRTHRKVAEAINRGYSRVRNAEDYDPDAVLALGADEASPVLPGLGEVPAAAADPEATAETRLDLPPEDHPDDRRRRVWKVMGLTAAAMFLLALVAITVVELGLGRALDGKGGTTISQVVRPSPSSKPTPSATPTAPTPTPTATSAEPSVTPTPTVTEPTVTSLPSPTEPATPVAAETSTP